MDRTPKSWTIQVIIAVAVLIVLVSTFARRGMAAEGRERWEMPRGPEIHHEWHGDIRRFHEEDLPRWRAGHWFHGNHLGQAGWWWVVDGGWYFYPAPIYPYPDPYVPPSIVVQGPPPPPSPSSEDWYYCASAQAYYPYAPTCPEGWMQVVPQR